MFVVLEKRWIMWDEERERVIDPAEGWSTKMNDFIIKQEVLSD